MCLHWFVLPISALTSLLPFELLNTVIVFSVSVSIILFPRTENTIIQPIVPRPTEYFELKERSKIFLAFSCPSFSYSAFFCKVGHRNQSPSPFKSALKPRNILSFHQLAVKKFSDLPYIDPRTGLPERVLFHTEEQGMPHGETKNHLNRQPLVDSVDDD